MAERGETLSETELASCRPIRGEGGRSWRAFCPFHGGDKQRSLRVEIESGRFQCYACGVWGYLDSARQQFKQSKALSRRAATGISLSKLGKRPVFLPRKAAATSTEDGVFPDLAHWLEEYQSSLPGSPGAEYLEERCIPLALAQKLGVGFAKPGRWAHRDAQGATVRDYAFGRLVFPHTDPTGRVVNLYGRALGERAPKSLRHDHLAGSKGYFHAPALVGDGPVYVCEGPFDALSLMAAEPGLRAVAIFGVRGWRWDWASAKTYVLALDADPVGQSAWRELALRLVLRGKQVAYLPPETYGGAKDLNEAWVAGILKVG